ncbi:MAG TPA: NAD-dependent epimerase/dehydratase family protein [Gemmataceae bacterium]|nr:NAD-dependent epimerase/dehydratase family protein [Gemmataceae bacterium]
MSLASDSRAGTRNFWSGRRVVVIGATGFIGHHVSTRLLQLGADVTVLVRPTSRRWAGSRINYAEGSLEDEHSLMRICRGKELVFHLAGVVDFHSDWERFRRVNVQGTRHVVAAARAAGARRLIYTSSIVAVGASAEPATLDETCRWNLGTLRIPYVTTKREAEELALSASSGALEVVAVNPASVVGPDDFASSEFGTLCRRFWRGRLPLYFGGGNNFVDVRDVALGHLLAAEHGRAGERYILGGENRTYGAFFADLARVAHKPIFRLRFPNAFASVVAALERGLRGQSPSKPYLTAGQACLLALFFFCTSRKANDQLGYQARPLRQSLRDAHDFWIGKRSA